MSEFNIFIGLLTQNKLRQKECDKLSLYNEVVLNIEIHRQKNYRICFKLSLLQPYTPVVINTLGDCGGLKQITDRY